MLTRPDWSGTRPARARSRVVLPAPFGPMTATISPSATASSALRARVPRITCTSRVEGHVPPSQRSRRATRMTREMASRMSDMTTARSGVVSSAT